MPSEVLAYTTKELSTSTWPDFERLFSQKNGWDFCWCMHFHRPRGLPKNKTAFPEGERCEEPPRKARTRREGRLTRDSCLRERRTSRMVPVRPQGGTSPDRQLSQLSRACQRHRKALENHLLRCP